MTLKPTALQRLGRSAPVDRCWSAPWCLGGPSGPGVVEGAPLGPSRCCSVNVYMDLPTWVRLSVRVHARFHTVNCLPDPEAWFKTNKKRTIYFEMFLSKSSGGGHDEVWRFALATKTENCDQKRLCQLAVCFFLRQACVPKTVWFYLLVF